MEEIMTNQPGVIDKSIDLIKTAPEILAENKTRQEKAIIVGNNIIKAILENGMTAETDERAKNYLVNVNQARKEMKEKRTGVTQIMDQLRTMYTTVENLLDPGKENTIPWKLQKHRDKYASELAAEAERKRREAERIAAKAKEAIDIKYQMETNYKNQFSNYLLTRKQKMQQGFNSITLENFEEKSSKLKTLTFSFTLEYEGTYTSKFRYHTDDELKAFSDAVITEHRQNLTDNFIAEMNMLRDDLVDKLPSKLAELQEQKRLDDEAAAEADKARIAEEKRQEEIKKANAAKRKQLEAEAEIQRQKEKERQEALKKKQAEAAAEQKRREEEEQENLRKAAAEQKLKSEQEAEIKKQGEQTMVLFDQEAMLADVEAPEAKTGYEIEVLHPVAYTQIFAMWFEHEGKNLPIDKIGNTKLDQMKAWAEKKAYKDGTKIESKFLNYKETFKAVNRKTKVS